MIVRLPRRAMFIPPDVWGDEAFEFRAPQFAACQERRLKTQMSDCPPKVVNYAVPRPRAVAGDKSPSLRHAPVPYALPSTP